MFRARLILALADDLSYRDTQCKTWHQRAHRVQVEEAGRAGRYGGPASRKQPATGNPDNASAGESSAHNRNPLMALAVPKTIGGVRRHQVDGATNSGQAKLRPHPLDRYVASNDPEFEADAVDYGALSEPAATRRGVLRR